MRVIRHLTRVGAPLERVVLTLGNFDGVHLGHQAIVRRAVVEARGIGGQVVALTFHPHPVAVLAPERKPPMIQSLHDRLACLRDLGADVVVLQRFTRRFAAFEPDAFVEDFLRRSLDLRHVVVGYNVNFGRNRAGSVATLRQLGARHGFAVDAVGPVAAGDATVSSSAVRALIASGDVAGARTLLGRPVALRGRVVHGEHRGRTLGFPTANLHRSPGLVLPADGVYAVRVARDGVRHSGVLNIGVRPTFGTLARTVEVHLLDGGGDLYGQWLVLEVVERLRGEQRFDGPEALRRAIAGDVARARVALARPAGDA